MISIANFRITGLFQRVSFSVRQQAAVMVARRSLRQLAAAVPWQSISTDAAVRLQLWAEIQNLCTQAGNRFDVPGDRVQEVCLELSLLKMLLTDQPKPQPVVLPMVFVAVNRP